MSDRNHTQPLLDIRERVREDWRRAAPGWTQWEPHLAAFLWPVSQRIMAGAGLTASSRVLDVGSGIGDPALQIAGAIAPDGTVLGVDLCDEMLVICRDRAKAYGLTNVTFRQTAAEEIDEPPASFDAIVARFSVIFFPDVVAGLRKLRDLLKPGGRISLSTWTPPDVNPAFAIPSREMRKVVKMPPPDPKEPGPFRLAEKGELKTALIEAGFEDVRIESVRLYQFGQDPDRYWDMLISLSALFRKQFDKLDRVEQDRVREGIKKAVSEYKSNGVIRVPALAQVGSAGKPVSA